MFLDSLDQLVAGEDMNLSWLPSELTGGVRLITTTRPGPSLDSLAHRLPENLMIELDRMPPDEGETLLDSWLENSGRTLTAPQRKEILKHFKSCGSPLYLRLAFEQARLWPSTLKKVRIGADEPSIIGQLYDRLEAEHGPQLVGHALGFLACTYERQGLSEDELLDALTADEQTWAEFNAGAEWEMPTRRLPVVVWSQLYFDLAPYLSPRASEGTSLLSFFHKELADAAQNRFVDGRSAHMHDVLTDVMKKLARGKNASTREWKGGAHALAELPYHLTRAERWDDLFATLTDFTYLEQTAKRVAVVTSAVADGNGVSVYNGVLALIDDYDRALAAFPAEQPLVDSLMTARSDQRLVLEAFGKTLVREAHNLTQRPDLLWQQTYNRLQWVNGPESDGVLSGVLEPELEERSRPGAGPWLHSLTRFRESEVLVRTLVGHTSTVGAVAYSPDGTRIVSGSADHTLKVWDAASGAELATLTGHAGYVEAAAYSPDGTRIVSGSADHTLKVWDAATGAELATLTGHAGDVEAVAYSPDGTRIVSGSYKTLKVWDAASGAELATLTGHTKAVGAVAYSPDGTRIISGSWDNTLKVWDAASGAELATLTGHTGAVRAAAYSPDGTRIVSGSWDHTLKVWDAATGAELATLTGHAGDGGCRGLLPGRHPHRLRLAGPHPQGVGRRHRRGARHPQRPRGRRGGRGLFPGRHPHRLRLSRPHPQGVGRRHRCGARHPQRPHRRGAGRGLFPGRHPHRLRLSRPHPQGVGRRQLRRARHPQRPHEHGGGSGLLPGRHPHRLRLVGQDPQGVGRRQLRRARHPWRQQGLGGAAARLPLPPHHRRPLGLRGGRGLFPGRHPDRLRLKGQHPQGVGRRQRRGARHPQRP